NGFGPIGASVLLNARAAGAGAVFVSEPHAARRSLAARMGATVAFDPGEVDVRREVFVATDRVGPDAVFDCTGVPALLPGAVDTVRKGGRVVVVGIGHGRVEIEPNRLALFEREVVGSLGYRHDLPRVVGLLAAGRLDPGPYVSAVVPLTAAVDDGFDVLLADRAQLKVHFDVTPEQEALKDLCRDFARKEIAPYAADWWEKEVFPADVFRTMGKLGLMGLLVPEEYGGSNAGMVAYVAAMEEIGAADQSVGAAWNAHITIGTLPLLAFGTEEQRQRWVRPLAEGLGIGAFGLTEPEAGSDAAGIRTRARRDGDGWVIDGTKMFISNAGTEMSLGVTILAVTGEDDGRRRYGSFFIPDGTPGYSKGERLKKVGWHALDTRELVFDDCRVPADHLVGSEGNGLRQFLEIL